jgi:hypothetical protein
MQKCNYFTVHKIGKKIDDYYVTKALQLYLEGSYREIERIIESRMSPSAIGKIVQHQEAIPRQLPPTYKIFNHLSS